jgi:hypothetical protein
MWAGLRYTTYLWVCLDYGHAPCPMRLFGVCPEKVLAMIGGVVRVATECGLLFLCPDGEAPAGGLLWRHGGGSD